MREFLPGKKISRTNAIISLGCLILYGIGIYFHEIWLDEAHHMLLGIESKSFSELFYNGRYEGHPLLLNCIFFILYHVFHQVWPLQFFNIIISAASIYLILTYSPFNNLTKWALVFSYFLFYEFSVITRSYALSVFLIILLLVFIHKKKNFLLIAAIIFLLINTHIFSAFVALGICLFIYPQWQQQPFKTKCTSLLIICFAYVVCLWQCIPPHNHFYNTYFTGSSPQQQLKKISWIAIKGLFPIPDWRLINYWNSNIIINQNKIFAFIISALVFLAPVFLFWKQKKYWLLFYVPLTLIILYFYLTPLMLTSRNCGYVSILLFVCLWFYFQKENSRFMYPQISKFFLGIILFGQVSAGIIAFYKEIKYDFSKSDKASIYLANMPELKKNNVVLLSHACAGPSLFIKYKCPVFYLEENNVGTFCKWHTNPFVQSDSALLFKIKNCLDLYKSNLLVLNQPDKMNELITTNNKLKIIENFAPQCIAKFDSAVVSSENYFLYKIPN